MRCYGFSRVPEFQDHDFRKSLSRSKEVRVQLVVVFEKWVHPVGFSVDGPEGLTR